MGMGSSHLMMMTTDVTPSATPPTSSSQKYKHESEVEETMKQCNVVNDFVLEKL